MGRSVWGILSVSDHPVPSQEQTNNMIGVTSKSLICVLLATSCTLGVKTEGTTALKADEGAGRIYFTGPGYTVNLIPHALVLGLLGLALIFLYGDSLFGSSTADAIATGTGYGAPDTGYGAPEDAYGAPEAAYGAPEPSYGAPSPSYSAPSTGYNAAASVF